MSTSPDGQTPAPLFPLTEGAPAPGDQLLPRGFQWGAVRAGIKASGAPDLAAVFLPSGGHAAALFTSNAVVAAPIIVGREHLAVTSGKLGSVLVNAGNANCATGAAGLAACRESCTAAAETFGCVFDEVIPSSTGIIGVPFPLSAVLGSLPALHESLGDTHAHAEAFAEAILTTDTRRKIARAVIDVDDKQVRLLGICKGAGMIAPALDLSASAHATMLVYLFTDLAADAPTLQAVLAPAVDRTFNAISIDGDTSTNDTVLLIASGASGISAPSEEAVRPEDRVLDAFSSALELVCRSLARQIVADGEGVSHVVELHISGAVSVADARQVARTIAHSPLCKTAWSSADPNWGRLLAAAGRSGVLIDPATLSISIETVPVFLAGERHPDYDEAQAHAAMLAPEYTIHLDLGQGNAEWSFLTCDLTADYVRINADYST